MIEFKLRGKVAEGQYKDRFSQDIKNNWVSQSNSSESNLNKKDRNLSLLENLYVDDSSNADNNSKPFNYNTQGGNVFSTKLLTDFDNNYANGSIGLPNPASKSDNLSIFGDL